MKGTAADLSIEENLALAYRRGKTRSLRWGIHRSERENYKERLKLLDLGLENRLKSKVGLLSGGQRQALTLLMATLQKPKLLLLDEHTAALDPKTAAKVLHITEQIIEQDQLTALMITHNMKDALRMGNRLVMMHDGKIIFDVEGEEKKKLTVSDLLEKFQIASGDELANDRMLFRINNKKPECKTPAFIIYLLMLVASTATSVTMFSHFLEGRIHLSGNLFCGITRMDYQK